MRKDKRLTATPRTPCSPFLSLLFSYTRLLNIIDACGQPAASECPLVAARFPPLCSHFRTCGLSAQVLDWIENHGEAFLSKHTGVGKSLHRARALQKRHEDFEEVAQVA